MKKRHPYVESNGRVGLLIGNDDAGRALVDFDDNGQVEVCRSAKATLDRGETIEHPWYEDWNDHAPHANVERA